MTFIQHQIEINWPVKALFNYVSDLSNNREWQHQVVKASWVGEERNAPGSSFVQTRVVMGKEITATMQVVEFHRYEKRSWRILHDPVQRQLAVAFEPRGENTLMTLTIEFQATLSSSHKNGVLMRHAVKEGYNTLQRLKNVLENSI